MAILDFENNPELCDSIRRLLGTADEDVLPCEDISNPILVERAELTVLESIGFYDMTEEEQAAIYPRVRLAIMYLIAIMLCPTMPARVDIEVKTIDVTWKRKPVDYDKLAEDLRREYEDLLDDLVEIPMDIIFEVAPSKAKVWGCRHHFRKL